MVATKTKTKFFKTISTRQFLLLAQNDKKRIKKFNFAFPLKNRDVFYYYSAY